MVISMAAQELASYYEVVLNKYKSQKEGRHLRQKK